MENSYTIVFHFEGTSLTHVFSDQMARDKAFDRITDMFRAEVSYYLIDDTIINISKVLCITKGENTTWKSESAH